MTNHQLEIKKYSKLIHDIKEMELKLTGYLWALEGQSQMNSSHIVNMKQSEEKSYNDLKNITESSTDIATLANEISTVLFSVKKDMGYTSSQTRNSSDQLSKMSEQITIGTEKLNVLKRMLHDMTKLSNNVRNNIKSLEDISVRIDVLSINASIEAARAGTYGVGFKVVATEIKKLSLASNEFSRQITQELNDIDSHNKEVLDAMSSYGKEQKDLTENLKNGAKHWNECDILINRVLLNVNNITELTINQNANINMLRSKSESLLIQNKQNLRASSLVEKSLELEESILSNLTESNTELRKKLNENEITSILTEETLNSTSIKIGHDLAYPPWVYLHQGASTGLSVDYCKDIMNQSNITVEFVAGQWKNLLDKLESGEIDFIANVGWPNKYLKDGPYLITESYASFDVCYFQSKEWEKKDNNFTVTCQNGSYAAEYIPSGANFCGGEDNDILNFVQLVWQKTDRVMTERRVGEYISNNYFDGQIKAEEETRGSIDVVLTCHKRNRDLRDKFNDGIRKFGSIGKS